MISDSTQAATGCTNADGTSAFGDETFQHYAQGIASLLVDTDVTVL